MKKVEESMRGEVPKPYSVPEGYVPPTMMEQWRYAQRRSVGIYPFASYHHQCYTIPCRVHDWGHPGPMMQGMPALTMMPCLLCRHPYQKYGYGLVFIVGLGAYAAYTISKARLMPIAQSCFRTKQHFP